MKMDTTLKCVSLKIAIIEFKIEMMINCILLAKIYSNLNMAILN